jgi:penicillin-binding protein 1A
MRYALARSRNVPTVRLAQAIGMDAVVGFAHDLGIENDLDPNPSLALGTPSMSPLELTAAYTAFANLGTRVEPRFIVSLEDSLGAETWRAGVSAREAVDPAVAYILTDMLQDVVEYGTGTAVRSVGFWNTAAGKTGTTSDAKDVWFVGYTPGVVASVWIGFDTPRPILARASGGALAAPVWGRIMTSVAESRGDDGGWQPPENVVFHYVDPASGMVLDQECLTRFGEGPRREAFIAERVPLGVCPRRTDTSGWLSRFFSRVFRRDERARATFDYDPAPVTDSDRALGARTLPGTVEAAAAEPGPRSARRRPGTSRGPFP